MKTNVRKSSLIKIIEHRLRNLDILSIFISDIPAAALISVIIVSFVRYTFVAAEGLAELSPKFKTTAAHALKTVSRWKMCL